MFCDGAAWRVLPPLGWGWGRGALRSFGGGWGALAGPSAGARGPTSPRGRGRDRAPAGGGRHSCRSSPGNSARRSREPASKPAGGRPSASQRGRGRRRCKCPLRRRRHRETRRPLCFRDRRGRTAPLRPLPALEGGGPAAVGFDDAFPGRQNGHVLVLSLHTSYTFSTSSPSWLMTQPARW